MLVHDACIAKRVLYNSIGLHAVLSLSRSSALFSRRCLAGTGAHFIRCCRPSPNHALLHTALILS